MVRPRKIREREVLFIDPGVSDIDTLVGHLRTEVEPIFVSRIRPAARQMAQVLAEERGLAAIHIIAHGTSGQVCFASGSCSVEILPENIEHLAAIGRALAPGGDLRLWSCETGAGVTGARFVTALAEAVGANVSAATSGVGAASLGGTWDLEAPAGALTPLPPLTPAGLVRYTGTLPAAEITVTGKLQPYEGPVLSGWLIKVYGWQEPGAVRLFAAAETDPRLALIAVQNVTDAAPTLRVETVGQLSSQTIRRLGIEAGQALDLTS